MRKAVAVKVISIRLWDSNQSATYTVSFFGSSLLLETLGLSSKATLVTASGENMQKMLHYCKYVTTM